MSENSKQTPLYEWHLANGARMADFGGYEMPLWYESGPKQEHLSVISSAGIFDTSHMAAISIRGGAAFDLLQDIFSKDLDACIGPSKKPLEPGRCVYGVFLNENGGVIDDALVYMNHPGLYTVIVNAGMGGPVSEHLSQQAPGAGVLIDDLTDSLGKIDVQGPSAAKILSRVIQNPEAVFEKMPYFSFKGDVNGEAVDAGDVQLHDGTPILLSRTGYTGEFGFEIFLEAGYTVTLWEQLLEAGRAFDLIPCGLAARDSLRAGAVLPLSHQDIGGWPFVNTPWPFALPFDEAGTGFTKPFYGSEALMGVKEPDFTHAFVGFDPRKVVPGDDVMVLDEGSNEIGAVLTCATDMAIDRHEGNVYSIASEDRPGEMKFRGLCCGFVKTSRRLETGELIYLRAGKRKLKVEVVADVRPARTARRAIAKML